MNVELEKEILAAAKTPEELRRAMKVVRQLWMREVELQNLRPQFENLRVFPLTPEKQAV